MKTPRKTVAIYCRKSTDEGLDREFNSLDAQRQCCEQFIASQAGEGWVASAELYTDGGFSGSNTERPALRRLLADVEAGKVQVIAVYKIDRLSRSLTDFVGLLQTLEKHHVAFVSVTQHFNTATPMGRLMLNILICFAQFERENMIERVRDKVAATKRMGRWCGGVPILGYDVAPGGRRLLVNVAEAEQVRAIYALYLEQGSLSETLREIERRSWTNKAWINGKGEAVGGRPLSKSSLAHLLGNLLYTGQVRYRGEVFPGEHPAVIPQELFDRVQQHLAQQARSGGATKRIKHHALLRGLLRCGSCDCAMTFTWTKRKTRMYGYYTCVRSRERGAATCPMPTLPAAEIERMAVAELAAIAKEPSLVEQVVAEALRQHEVLLADLRSRLHVAETLAVQAVQAATRAPDDLVQAGLRRQAETQVGALERMLAEAEAATPDSRSSRRALAGFEPVWAELSPRERCELLRTLVERVTLDGHAGTMAFTFRSDGLGSLAERQEVSA